MPIKCKTNFIWTWSANGITAYISVANLGATFAMADSTPTL